MTKMKRWVAPLLSACLCLGGGSVTEATAGLTVKIVNNSGVLDDKVFVLTEADGNICISPTMLEDTNAFTKVDGQEHTYTLKNPITSFNGGRIYFSFYNPMPNRSSIAPVDPDVETVRYDSVELTYMGNTEDVANLTAVEQFGIPMSLEVYKGGVKLMDEGEVGFQKSFTTTANALKGIAPSAYKTSKKDKSFIRVVSPTKAYGNKQDDYKNAFGPGNKSISGYLQSLSGKQISIKGLFVSQSGNAPYNYTGTFGGVDSFTLKEGDDTIVIGGTIDNNGDKWTLERMISMADGWYQVNNSTKKIGDNDKYSAVVRDFLVGFNLGFYGNKGAGDSDLNDSSSWRHEDAFKGPYYNQYAQILSQGSNAYGFAFSDYLGKVFVTLDSNRVDTLVIYLWSDDKESANYVTPAPTPKKGDFTLSLGIPGSGYPFSSNSGLGSYVAINGTVLSDKYNANAPVSSDTSNTIEFTNQDGSSLSPVRKVGLTMTKDAAGKGTAQLDDNAKHVPGMVVSPDSKDPALFWLIFPYDPKWIENP